MRKRRNNISFVYQAVPGATTGLSLPFMASGVLNDEYYVTRVQAYVGVETVAGNLNNVATLLEIFIGNQAADIVVIENEIKSGTLSPNVTIDNVYSVGSNQSFIDRECFIYIGNQIKFEPRFQLTFAAAIGGTDIVTVNLHLELILAESFK